MIAFKNRSGSKIVTVTLFLTLALFELTAFPKAIVSIGDSFGDSGNLPVGELEFLHPPLTDGQTYVTQIAAKLGAEQLLPSSYGGLNYNWSGALAADNLILNPSNPNVAYLYPVLSNSLTVPSLLTQINAIPDSVSRNFPVFIEGGSNDYFWPQFEPAGPPPILSLPNPLDLPAFQMLGNLQALHEKGFQYIVMLNGDQINFGSYTDLFNQTLYQGVKNLSFPVLLVDLNSLENALFANPGSYGFTNLIPDPVAQAGLTTVGQLYWYDGEHPTNAFYRIVSDYIYSLIRASTYFAALAEIPMETIKDQNRIIKQQIGPMQPVHCDSYFFLGGNYAPLLEGFDEDVSESGQGGSAMLGAVIQKNENIRFGISAGYDLSSAHLHDKGNNSTCEFNFSSMTETMNLFTSYQAQKGYVDLIANIAWHQFYKIRRRFDTGPVSHIAHGKTKGMQYGAELDGAYFVYTISDLFYFGFIAQTQYQFIHIDGFTEKKADIGNVSFKDQHNQALNAGGGIEFLFINSTCWGTFYNDFCLLAKKEWLGTDRQIYVGEASLPGTYGVWPIEGNLSPIYASGSFNTALEFKNEWTLSIGYFFDVGARIANSQLFALSINIPLKRCVVNATSSNQCK